MSLLAPGTYDIPPGSAIIQPSGDTLTLIEGGALTVPVPPVPDVTPIFDSSYEGGNGTNPVFSSPSVVQVDAEPDPVQNWTTNFDFEIGGALGGCALTAMIRFKWGVVDKFAGTPLDKNMPWYSVDGGATWSRATLAAFDLTAKMITVTTPPLPAGTSRCRIAETPPYTMAQYESDLARWQATGWCSLAAIGTSVNGYPIWRLTVTNPAYADANKKRVYLTSEWHPQERFTSRRLRGLLDWLTAASPEAATMRNRRIVHVVLRPNPDGVAAGWMRVNAQGKELNRWSVAPDLAAEGPEQYAVHSDVVTVAASSPGLRMFIDFHTSNADGDYLAAIDSAMNTMNFWTYDGVHRLWQYPFSSTPGVPMSHKVVADTIPGVSCAYFDSAQFKYRWPAAPGNLVTAASSEAVGSPIARTLDAWLQAH